MLVMCAWHCAKDLFYLNLPQEVGGVIISIFTDEEPGPRRLLRSHALLSEQQMPSHCSRPDVEMPLQWEVSSELTDQALAQLAVVRQMGASHRETWHCYSANPPTFCAGLSS